MVITEEDLRSRFLNFLIESKGFPQGLVTKEKPPNLFDEGVFHKRERRVDILVSYRREDQISPLLLVECKKKSPIGAAYNQLLGYNMKLKAVWCALVWPMSYVLFHKDVLVQSGTLFDFPKYETLCEEAVF